MPCSHNGPTACHARASASLPDLQYRNPPSAWPLCEFPPHPRCRDCCRLSVTPVSDHCGCWPRHQMGLSVVGRLLSQKKDHFLGTCQAKGLPFELRDAVAPSVICRKACTSGHWFCSAAFLVMVMYLCRHRPVLSLTVSSDRCHIHF